MAGVITASEPSWIAPFTGLSPRAFAKLMTVLRREGADAVRRSRPWSLPLEDRAPLVATYRRTNLTMRQLAALFGVSKSVADRIIVHLGPMLALQPRERFAKDTVLIVDGPGAPPGITLSPRMEALREPLDEAFRSAPKFEAGVARSHGFGTRALEDFKDSKVWLKVDSNGNYDLNLAANEYMANVHTLDKHVGKTDEQLAQRLRDQQSGGPTTAWPHGRPMPSGSSAFPNYQRAEESTERNLNTNRAAIKAWIKGPPPASDGDVKSFYDTVPSGETSGRSVSKQPVDPNDPLSGYKQGGLNAKAYDVSGVDTRLRYDSSRNPPFTVMTSMPSKS